MMLIAQKSHLTIIELDTHVVDLGTVEQGLLAAMAADRLTHEQIVERIRRLIGGFQAPARRCLEATGPF